MAKTAVVFSPICYRHNPGRRHPESARRLRSIVTELKRSHLTGKRNWQYVKPERASIQDVELIHNSGYVETVEKICRLGGGVLDSGDTVVSSESFDVALYAVGATLRAVNLVMGKQFENSFALVRPPGHHAEEFCARGFCIFNNIAIAAKHLLTKYKLERILILDIDAHHGNGTQKSFYETDRVLYMSLHEDPTEFPKTGFLNEIGQGIGLGYTVNIPFPFKTTDQIYLKAVNDIVVPIIHQYKPQFILLSSGFDGHYTDPVGNLSLSANCYATVYSLILRLASKMCNGRLVAVLEGGYSIEFVGQIASAVIAQMSGTKWSLKDRVPPSRKHVQFRGIEMLKKVEKVHKDFWNVNN